jgi:hypothetical protein
MRAALALVLMAVGTGCAIVRPGRMDRESCEFVVYNRTSYALDIRAMRDTTGRAPTLTLGTLDPGERLSDRVPCDQGAVWIRGYSLPPATWLPARFPYIEAWSELTPGEKPSISLHWP